MAPNVRSRKRPAWLAPVPAGAAELSPDFEIVATERDAEPTNFADLRLKIAYLATSDLRLPRRELRTHSSKQIEQIAASIQNNGNLHPLVVGPDDMVVSGAGRLRAARHLGLDQVPVIRASHLTAEQLRLFAITDNKLAENSSWALDELKVELCELGRVPGLDLETTGFSGLEIETITLAGAAALTGARENKEVEEPDEASTPVTRLGDIFAIGNHMIICGNARFAETYERLMGGEKARLVFGDLPYNVKIINNVSGLGKKRHGEFDAKLDKLNQAAGDLAAALKKNPSKALGFSLIAFDPGAPEADPVVQEALVALQDRWTAAADDDRVGVCFVASARNALPFMPVDNEREIWISIIEEVERRVDLRAKAEWATPESISVQPMKYNAPKLSAPEVRIGEVPKSAL